MIIEKRNMIEKSKEKVLAGGSITFAEASTLYSSDNMDALLAAADEIRLQRVGNNIDTCCIVNARSGKCSENCKWCAQSAHYATHIHEYERVSDDEAMAVAQASARQGVARYSLVTSGRRMTAKELPPFCEIYRRVKESTGLYLCASMGLLGKEELQMLYDAGVRRYHCNLETASSYFPALCSTHTSEQKKQTIRWAREVGMEICSGGIIGMGETVEQRIELAFELRELQVASVPVNILSPIPGTPLETTPLLDEESILRTIAVYRFVLPDAVIRFAGGRMRLSEEAQLRALRGGLNGALVGDLLTTVGKGVEQDSKLFAQAGYRWVK